MGLPFLSIGRILIDVAAGELIMWVNNKEVVFNIFKVMEYLETIDDYFAVNVIKQTITEVEERGQFSDPSNHILTSKLEEEEDEDLVELMAWMDYQPGYNIQSEQPKPLLASQTKLKMNFPSIISPTKLELKPLTKCLMYAFLVHSDVLPVIISA